MPFVQQLNGFPGENFKMSRLKKIITLVLGRYLKRSNGITLFSMLLIVRDTAKRI